MPEFFNFTTDVVGARAAEAPDKVALIAVASDGVTISRYTFSDLLLLADRTAHLLLSHGIGKGDKVFVQLPRVVEWYAALLGCFQIGAISMPGTTARSISFGDYMSHKSVDVVIIGGGIMGMSIAYQVARRSSMSVVVIEKGIGLGEGSTGGSSAITRQRYSKVESVRIARDGNVVWRNWSEYTGLSNPVGRFHDIGVLWMMTENADEVAVDRDRLVAEGVDAVKVGAAELHKLYPGLSACMVPFDLTGEVEHECADGDAFLIERDTGFFDVTGALDDVATAARARGVEVKMRSEVVGVTVESGRVQGVMLADGSAMSTGLVINAAGPWCNQVNAMAGLEMTWRLVPTRIQVIYRVLPPEVPRPFPVVIDAAGGIYFRPEAGGGQIIAGSILEEDELEEADPDSYNTAADRSFIDLKIHALHHRIPSFPHIGVPGGIASLYTVNRQDVLPIVGPTSIDGFAVVNGFSGHGFKESQMIGSMMAQWITGERADFDTDVPMEFFSVDRDPIDIGDHTVLA